MNIKFTLSQFEGFHLILRYLLDTYSDPDNIADDLLREIIKLLEQRVAMRLLRINRGTCQNYSLKFTKIEALAFFLWYRALIPRVPPQHYHYERIVCERIMGDIDKHFT